MKRKRIAIIFTIIVFIYIIFISAIFLIRSNVNRDYNRYMYKLGYSKTENPTKEEIEKYRKYIKLYSKSSYEEDFGEGETVTVAGINEEIFLSINESIKIKVKAEIEGKEI